MLGLNQSKHWPIGCDIQDHVVRLVQYQAGAVPPGVVAGSAPITKDDPQSIVRAVTELRERLPFVGHACVMGVRVPALCMRTLEVVPMPEADMQGAIHWQLARELGVEHDTYACGFFINGRTERSGKPSVEVLAFGAPVDHLTQQVRQLEQAGLTVLAIDAGPASVARAIAASGLPEVNAVLDMSDGRRLISIVEAGEPRFVRPLQQSNEQIDQLIAQRLSISPAEAEVLRQRHGADTPNAPVADQPSTTGGEDEAARQVVHNVIRFSANDLSRQITLSLQYFSKQYKVERLNRVVVVSGDPTDQAVARLMGADVAIELVNMPKLPGADWEQIDTTLTGQGCWALAAGLSLYDWPEKEMRRVA